MKWIAMLIVLLCGVACLAQSPTPNPIQYYWDPANRVYLWLPNDAAPFVVASHDKTRNQWKYLPDKPDANWKAALLEVIKHAEPNADCTQCSETQLWEYNLSKLQNELGRDQYLKLRSFKSQIYVQKIADDKVTVTFLYTDANEKKSAPHEFLLKPGGGWEKLGIIDLEAIVNLSPSSAEVVKIFKVPPATGLPATPETSRVFWDLWIKQVLGDSTTPIRFPSYKDTNGDLQYAMIKRLDPGEPVPTELNALPPHPGPIAMPLLPQKNGTQPAFGPYDQWIIALLLIAVAVLLLRNVLANRKPKARPPVIENIDDSVRKRLRGRFDPAKVPGGEFLLSAEEFFYNEYSKLIDSEQSTERSEKSRNEAIDSYLTGLGVDPSEKPKLKKWINAGRAAERDQEVIDGILALEGVKTVIGKSRDGYATATDWNENWPIVIRGLDESLTSLRSLKQIVDEKLNDHLASREQDIAKASREVKEELTVTITKLKEQNSTVAEQAEQIRKKLETELDKSADLTATIKKQDQQISDLERAAPELKKLQDKVGQIKEVANLSNNFRPWIQAHYDSYGEDINATGLFAALINHSIYQMCFGIMEDRPVLRTAMAANLYRCADVFKSHHAYSAVVQILKRIEPEISGGPDGFSPSGLKEKTHDDAVIRTFLREFKTGTGINLGPFYICQEKDNALYRVATS